MRGFYEQYIRKFRQHSLRVDAAITVFFIVMLGVFSPDKVVIAAYLFFYPYLIFTRRRNLYYHLLISSLLAFIWVFFASDEYGYTVDYLTFSGINLFPFFGWSAGLFATYLLYSHIVRTIGYKAFVKKFILYVWIYWFLLITTESIGHHVFGINNIVSSTNYPGLPFCNCIHAPKWMQGVYLAMGPLYFIICSALKLENNSKKEEAYETHS